MASHMKTTVQIPDSLLQAARKLAQREHATLRALVEQGLRRTLAERGQHGGFHLRRVTFKGQGLQPGVAGASGEQIREVSYEGRGA